jgi:predicted GNAT superfamily acetyltransferase
MTDAPVDAPVDAWRSVDRWRRRTGLDAAQAPTERLGAVVEVFEATWGVGRSPDRSFFTALAHAGNPVILVTDGDQPAGAAFAMLGWNDGLHLHSHMAAVLPGYRGRGVGGLMKLVQRADALEHGIREIRWTYDPLVLRNARFNLGRLGARVVAFHRDFYGRLGDAVSGDDASDRFEVAWELDSPRVLAALAADSSATPQWVGERRLELPPDYHALRAEDPAEASRLRARSRQVIESALTDGLRPETDTAGYVFVADEPGAEDRGKS